MIALIQRVNSAAVAAEGTLTGKIEKGLTVYLGVFSDDTIEDMDILVKKIPKLRIFPDSEDKLNLSLEDVGGDILVISNFTLCGKMKSSGNRPSYFEAMRPETAELIYKDFIAKLTEQNINVQHGVFGADMQVSCVVDGPVNILLDSKKIKQK